MTTLALEPPRAAVRSATLGRLSVLEARRYARSPLFLLGVVLTVVGCLVHPDRRTSSYFDVIVPAAALGVLGLVAMAGMTKASRRLSRSAGAPPVQEATQTAALALACLVPFAVGVLWFGWAVWAAHQYPPVADGFPFGPVSPSWKVALLFGGGAMPALGGPLLGVAIGRWLPQRGAAQLAAVALVVAVIVMQGLFAPLRRVRVVMPWTYFGGPIGIKGDDMRTLVLSGSPQWWVGYLACLCGLTIVAALWHDPDARTPRLRGAAAALGLLAAVTCLLAMFGGVGHTLVNPLHST